MLVRSLLCGLLDVVHLVQFTLLNVRKKTVEANCKK